jgi:(2Fe-2S) ferredoxin
VPRRFKIIVCRGPECGDRHGSKALHAAFEHEIQGRGLAATVDLGWHSCFGRCTQGPNVLVSELNGSALSEPRFAFAVLPGARTTRSALYNGCAPDDAATIVEQHILQGTLVRRLIRPVASSAQPAASVAEPAQTLPKRDRRSDGDG